MEFSQNGHIPRISKSFSIIFISAAIKAEGTNPLDLKVSFQGPDTGPCTLTQGNETWVSSSNRDYGHNEVCHQGKFLVVL